MSQVAVKSLLICVLYGLMSIAQTVNSRYLYRNLNFDFYSMTFGMQRLVIIMVFMFRGSTTLTKKMLITILPYSFFMSLSNILSSYCLTIMPLAAFLSFKKFIVLFILGLTVALKLPVTTNRFQNFCIVGIVLGGALVGEKDLLHGDIIGYASCLMFGVTEAINLHYAAYLYREHKLQPQQLLLYNCIISFPYYLIVTLVQSEYDDIILYFLDHFNLIFLGVLLLSIVLACLSQLSSSYIAMKISPFQKSTVSNIKDLVLVLISVTYYHDFTLTPISSLGMILCLISSALFSVPYFKRDDQVAPIPEIEPGQVGQAGEEGTSLLEERIGQKGQERVQAVTDGQGVRSGNEEEEKLKQGEEQRKLNAGNQ